MRLLIIDDSRLDRKMIKRLINQVKIGASVAEADGVETALSMVAVEYFDCILIDYHLGSSNGVALASKIIASHGEATPMVMLTAEPSAMLVEQALSSGLTDFMSKRNLSGEQLRQALCNALVKRKVAQRPQDETAADVGDDREGPPEMRRTVIHALSVFDRSAAVQQLLLEDEGAQIAIEMLRKAAMTPQHAH